MVFKGHVVIGGDTVINGISLTHETLAEMTGLLNGGYVLSHGLIQFQ